MNRLTSGRSKNILRLAAVTTLAMPSNGRAAVVPTPTTLAYWGFDTVNANLTVPATTTGGPQTNAVMTASAPRWTSASGLSAFYYPGTAQNRPASAPAPSANSSYALKWGSAPIDLVFQWNTIAAHDLSFSFAATQEINSFGIPSLSYSTNGTSYTSFATGWSAFVTPAATDASVGGTNTFTAASIRSANLSSITSLNGSIANVFLKLSFSGGTGVGTNVRTLLDNVRVDALVDIDDGTTVNNNSQIYLAGTTPMNNGASSASLHLGAALVNQSVPPGTFGLNKTGSEATTYSITSTSGLLLNSAASPLSGSFPAGTQTATVNVAAPSGATSTPGAKTWTVTVDNTATTTSGTGRGSSDQNDTLTVSANVYHPAQINVAAPQSSYDSGQSFTITSTAGTNFAAAEIRRTITGASAASWSLTGLTTAITGINPGNTLSVTPGFSSAGKPNGVYTATVNLSANNQLSIAGASLNDISLNQAQVQLSHTISDSSGGTVSLNANDTLIGYGGSNANTTARIRYGTTSAATSLAIQMLDAASLTSTGYALIGDAVEIKNIVSGDVYVLEMSFAPDLVNDPLTYAIVSRPGTSGEMQLAVAQNTSGAWPPDPVISSFSAYLAAHGGTPILGDYGVDLTAHTVWAVLDHNSEFAVAVVPEPAALGLLIPAATLRRRRRQAARRP